MSNYMGSLDARRMAMDSQLMARDVGNNSRGATPKSGNSLDMNDFLQLLVAQFQNQTIDNNADTSDMLNQLVQMTMIEAITNITDATVMMYSGSLVGKEVTVGKINAEGKIEEIVGTVTGTGSVGGQQVIFVDGESYYLSDIMAIGRLPEVEKPDGGTEKPDGGTEKPDGGTEKPEGGTKPEGESKPDGAQKPEA